MRFEHTDVYNFENAIRGMRHPLESYDRSDSRHITELDTQTIANVVEGQFVLGENDLDLAQRLIKGGAPHCKFMRQIFVSVDITAPMYIWSELDTYKVGTVANSTSKMHKLATTPITIDCFETDDYEPSLIFEEVIDDSRDYPWDYKISVEDAIGTNEKEYYNGDTFIGFLESLRVNYLETKDKRYWKELVRWLPESWLQTRTWTANYEVLRNIVYWRKGHKLSEWAQFIEWAHTLPYADELIFYEGGN